MQNRFSHGLNWSCQTREIDQTLFAWCGPTEDSNLVLADGLLATIDGRIYNREEIGEDSNDADTLLSLYSRYGFVEAIRRLNGDFAAAFYDAPSRTLWLARDRFGLKPLYYIQTPDLFAFASQPGALLALPAVSRNVNPQFVAIFAASHYRYFDNDPDSSPYAAIKQLPASHILRVQADRVVKTKYWSLEEQPEFSESESELAERYRELLFDAVQCRLRVSRRPAFTLSGGMDSSSVLASAVRMTGERQDAFSTVYADKTYDESHEIRSMLDTTVQHWHAVPIDRPDLFEVVRRMIRVHDEPVATATWLSHYVLCQDVANKGFGSLFGGLGGDELNAGEYEYFLYHFADLRVKGDEDRLQREIEFWIRYHDHPIFRKTPQVVVNGFNRLVDMDQPGRCRPDRARLDRYRRALNPDYFNLESFEPVMDHPFGSYLKNRTYQDMTRETAPCCLRAEDRQTTAFGLENFLPFFDYRLAEFMFRIPGTLKFRDGITKHLLRQAMKGVLPEQTRTRIKKTGWNAPAHVWFTGTELNDLRDLVRSQRFRERGIYNVEEVLRIIDEHEAIVERQLTADNHMMFLWQLVNLELWLEMVEGS